MYRKILYPTKFEEFSIDVLSYVLNFKKVGTEEIILLHVIDADPLTHATNIKKLVKSANTKMQQALKVIEDSGLKAKKRIEVGVPYKEILKVADNERVSLIVSGRQKKGIFGEIFIGSTTDKVIRYGHFPVYVPKYPATFLEDKKACERLCERVFHKILYPTDWSDCAEIASKYLRGLKDAGVEEVVVAHVMDEKAMRLQPADRFKEFKEIDQKKLELIRQDIGMEGIKVKTHLHVGKAGTDLIKIAQEEDVSLIIMGSHGKGYVEGMLWGSVSRNVVEYSDRPVLLIKSPQCLERI
ncbi:MAG: universal stress protein [Nitrospirae bacterium]|nr:universal stress protein [Nitrospirota bacterium]